MTAALKYVITSEPLFHIGDDEQTFDSWGPTTRPRIGDTVTLKTGEPLGGKYGDDVAVQSWDTRPSGAWRISASSLTKVGEPPKPARRVVDEGDLRAVAIGLGMKAADVETLLTLTAVVSAARAS